MSVLIDTNVVLDLLLARSPFAEDANAIFLRIEDGHLQACLCATTIATIDYFVASQLGQAAAREHIARLLQTFEIAQVNRAVLHAAVNSKLKDFEDAVLAESGKAIGAQTLITRNGKDFKACGLQVYSPREWLAGQ